MKKWLPLLLVSICTFCTQRTVAQDFAQMIKLISQKSTPNHRSTGDYFGYSVSVSGDYALVGANFEDEDASGGNTLTDAGSAYVFIRSGNTWQLQTKLVASDRGANDRFGISVSISGDYALVGANGEGEDASGGNTLNDAGSVYVFVRNGSSWSQQAKLVAADRGAGDFFGYSVSLSGDYALVGANNEDEDASGGNTLTTAGSAYVFMRNGSSWSQQAKLVAADRGVNDNFGISVSISGDYALVAASYEDEDASGGNTLSYAGSAYVFVRSGSSWSQQVKLVAADRGAGDGFGSSVSISGDYALVGAYTETEDASGGNMLSAAGSAYVFMRSGSSWSQQQKITAESSVQDDRGADDNFGYSVSVNGNYAIVGAPQEDEDISGGNTLSQAGSAYVFMRSGNTWQLQAKLVAADRGAGDWFGFSVSISGDYALVGARNEAEDASGGNTLSAAGSAYIFMRSGSSWSQQAKLVASDRGAGDWFGFSVSISGDYALVGAYLEAEDASGGNTLSQAGSAYVFVRSGSSWSQQAKLVASDRGAGDYFGYSVSISGDYALVGACLEDQDASGGNALSSAGSAYVFMRSGSSWSQQAKLVAADRGAGDYFGYSVSISGDYVIVGAVQEDHDATGGNTLTDAGSAYVFMRSGSSWSQQAKLVAGDRGVSDYFGTSVSISGDYALVGACLEDHDASGGNTLGSAGSAYVFMRSGSSWSQQAKLVAADRGAGDYFGISVSISGDYALVGARNEDEDASGGNPLSNAGSAYVFERNVALPLKLLSFTGTRKDGINNLVWKTANESNLTNYEVQRSTNGQEFITIATQKANNGIAQSYTYDDKIEFAGKLYYRIKINENDSKVSYSKIVTLTDNNQSSIINVYPNPARNIITIKMTDDSLQNTEVVVLNAQGRVVLKQKIQSTNQSINVSHLLQGLYFVKFANGEVQKLIKE